MKKPKLAKTLHFLIWRREKKIHDHVHAIVEIDQIRSVIIFLKALQNG